MIKHYICAIILAATTSNMLLAMEKEEKGQQTTPVVYVTYIAPDGKIVKTSKTPDSDSLYVSYTRDDGQSFTYVTKESDFKNYIKERKLKVSSVSSSKE